VDNFSSTQTLSNFALKPVTKILEPLSFASTKKKHTGSQTDKPTQKSNQIKLKSKFTKTATKSKYASTPPFDFLAPPAHSNPQITQSLASNSQSTHKGFIHKRKARYD
jgi:hypothetical protein